MILGLNEEFTPQVFQSFLVSKLKQNEFAPMFFLTQVLEVANMGEL